MPHKRIVLVASPLGRCGTSAMMGLLKIAGADIGKPSHVSKPSIMNPKGFFELSTFKKFMQNTFGIYYGKNLSVIPTIKHLEKIATSKFRMLDQLLKKEFSKSVVAIKSQRYLKIPLFYRLRNRYNIRVVCMHRNINNQVKSIMRMWRTSNVIHSPNTFDSVKKELIRWKRLSSAIRENYKLPYLKIQFEDFIRDPIKQSLRLFDFLDVKSPSSLAITNWIDRRLVTQG